MKPKFLFGDIVVIDESCIGVIVKTWKNIDSKTLYYDVYDRSCDTIVNYPENKIERYAVRHKYLNDEELKYQKGYEQGV